MISFAIIFHFVCTIITWKRLHQNFLGSGIDHLSGGFELTGDIKCTNGEPLEENGNLI